MINAVITFQFERIKSNLVTFTQMVAVGFGVLYVGFKHGTILQSIVYLFAMWLCSFLIDFYALKRQATNDFIVRDPKRETLYFFGCLILGLLFFFVRFSGIVDWDHLNRWMRLAFVPLILFVYPVALAVIFLLLKYKPHDLGVRFQGFLIALPVIAVVAIAGRLVSPESLTFDRVLAEGGGIFGAIFTGFILAGLSEEFFRVIGQTRIGALLNNKGLGWFFTTVIWALLHAPKWYADDHNLSEALLGSIRIIPLGLLWGYMTHRTKSILPAVLVHGSNIWGLQNF